MPTNRLLEAVAKAVSDGAAVNWDEADSEAVDPQTRAMLRHLRTVAEIADLHRKTVDEDQPPLGFDFGHVVDSGRRHHHHQPPAGQTADGPAQEGPLPVADTWAHLTLREIIGRG